MGSENDQVSDAFLAARELLERAEQEAAGIRSDADRYLQRREQEAELLVAKARRVLTSAEDKAAAITARARDQAHEMLAAAGTAGATSSAAAARAAIDAVGAPAGTVTVIDLVAEEVPDAAPDLPAWKAEGVGRSDSGLDRILASAISNAVQRALPDDR